MNNQIKMKITAFCTKGNMDIKNLKITKNERGYVADDGRMSMMFDEQGKPISLPMNRTYSNMGSRLGKGIAIIYLAVIIGLIVLSVIGVFVNKFM